MKTLCLIAIAVLIAMCFMITPVLAQTPDGQTPNQETVCDDAGLTANAQGICNAYCEAMDCDSDCPRASWKACQKKYDQFVTFTGSEPPCEGLACPCWSEDQLESWAYSMQLASCSDAGPDGPQFNTTITDNILQYYWVVVTSPGGHNCGAVTDSETVNEENLTVQQANYCRELLVASELWTLNCPSP